MLTKIIAVFSTTGNQVPSSFSAIRHLRHTQLNMAGATEGHHSGSIEHSVNLETQKREITEEAKKSLVKGDIWWALHNTLR